MVLYQIMHLTQLKIKYSKCTTYSSGQKLKWHWTLNQTGFLYGANQGYGILQLLIRTICEKPNFKNRQTTSTLSLGMILNFTLFNSANRTQKLRILMEILQFTTTAIFLLINAYTILGN